MRSTLLAWSVAIALGLGMTTAHAADAVTVKIGQSSPLTGPQAHIGKDNDNGVRLAIDEINATKPTIGGKAVTFEVMSEDDQADPKTATIVAQRMVDEEVAGVIGHLNSGATIPASKVYSDNNVPQVSPSATAIKYTAQGFKTAYRVMTNDEQQGKVLGAYAAKLGKKVAIVDDQTAYGQGLAAEVEKAAKAAGAEVVAVEHTNDKATDFTAILTSIKGKEPDVIFFGGMDPQGAPMAKQMRQLGIKAQFLGGDGMQTPKFIELAGADAEGTIASIPGLPLDKMPKGTDFKQKFEAKYGQIQLYAPYAYDAAYVMVDAMKRADSTDPEKYLPELAKTSYEGVTGKISFDAKGDLTSGPITLYTVKGGKWETLETIQP
ncbi:MAG TPA: branched-chain amino acid ABC transporter substrate-binding protein [Candidatus Thiothrix moscowensis]|uniref:branched-chain amino acid ABC transporter substrate-binding protein n=1 Tax=unclassified Thiothrix TaxID=2636184 RepID=UPI0025F92E12|nr:MULTISPECIES: branched-chain amino acid ABC transporter substrate-binding protein [unclassified Thiothrix]HRJ52165.1 branched-chain amino acid ABC transporter substrate-binding protein [Candidatus Thiothrix moscowensis]HRJ92324.1 branched-chain amino acid ABC transporter substrate-binding protein [Candidatus Thiothrix moscowensis]